MEIQLKSHKSMTQTNVSNSINVSLVGNTKVMPSNDIMDTISAAEQYIKERKASTKYRLSFQVNVVSSNILCNDITEIVRNEGTDDVECINFQKVNEIEGVIGKNASVLTSDTSNYKTKNAIRDTQLSQENVGFVYHCGKDILNNHLIRSNTFKMVNATKTKSKDFNTIFDTMRDWKADDIYDYVYLPVGVTDKGKIKLHTYEFDDIDSYSTALEEKLELDYEGWLGFYNRAKLIGYEDFADKDTAMKIDRPISYKNAGDFVDLYPTRDLFSFVPKYNKFRQRVEKNWNYCITYPSSSVTENFDFIDTFISKVTKKPVNSLRALWFDESTKSDSKQTQTVIYSMTKHGLSEGDFVNIYIDVKEEDDATPMAKLMIANAQVTTIVDDYIFTIFNNAVQISDKWVETDDPDKLPDGYELQDGYLINNEEGKKYIIINKKANVENDEPYLSYKKIDGDNECDYYVRIFSKFPNFKFVDRELTESELYAPASDLIRKYSTHENEFESHATKNAFARNIYGDKNAQIVFTDDIDINLIKDNRGRPISELFLTIIKNNKGYKDWYGIYRQQNLDSEEIEYSHCFGKVNCAFEMAQETTLYDNIINVFNLSNSITTRVGGNGINLTRTISAYTEDDNDEVNYYQQDSFIGDLVCYSNSNMVEQSIQNVMHRFNTAQRELTRNNSSVYDALSQFTYDEIYYDDYDFNTYEIQTSDPIERATKDEGYYYNPHYRIPLRTFSSLNTVTPQHYRIRSVVTTNKVMTITVVGRHNLTIGDKIMMYDSDENIKYMCEVQDVFTKSSFSVVAVDDNGVTYSNSLLIDYTNTELKQRYKFLNIMGTSAPSYAEMVMDGSCRLMWRDIVPNGFSDTDGEIEEYPFTNDRFYINTNIILYNRRQDPDGIYGLYNNAFPADIAGVVVDIESENNGVEEEDIEC